MSSLNTQLIGPIYTQTTVKVPHNPISPVEFSPLGQLRIPRICPHCLKPGEITEFVHAGTLSVTQGYMRYTSTINIPFSTHSECSQGWGKKNISNSVKLRIEGNQRVVFQFREPFFATIFTSVNFPIVQDAYNAKLSHRTSRYLESLEIQKKQGYKREQKTCPRCQNSILVKLQEEYPDTCPSCGYSFAIQDPNSELGITSDAEQIPSLPDDFISCPQCGIAMLNVPELRVCGRCGYNLGGV